MGLGLYNGVASPNLLLRNGPIPVIPDWWREGTKLPENPVVDFTRPSAHSTQVTPVSQLSHPDYKPTFNLKTTHDATGHTDYGWNSEGKIDGMRRRDPWSNFVNKILRPAFGISSEEVSGSDIDYSNNLSSWLSNLLKHFA